MKDFQTNNALRILWKTLWLVPFWLNGCLCILGVLEVNQLVHLVTFFIAKGNKEYLVLAGFDKRLLTLKITSTKNKTMSKNLVFETQFKNFFILWKSHVLFLRSSFFYILNHSINFECYDAVDDSILLNW